MINKLDFLAIGEVMAEIRQGTDDAFSVGFAGDTFNTAVYCARELSEKPSVGYYTRVGTDPLSQQFISVAESESLDASHIAADEEKQIGIYAVATDESGERSFSYWRDDSAARTMFSNHEALRNLPDARIVYLSGITLAIISASARRRLMDHLKSVSRPGSVLVAFDSNYRPQLWEDKATAQTTIEEMWNIADIALPSIDDEMDLFDDATEEAVIRRFSMKAWHACAIKRGANGPVSPTLPIDELPEFAAASHVTDTTSAGDSFNGGYLAALLQGKSEPECMLAGHRLASIVVGHSGAIIPAEVTR